MASNDIEISREELHAGAMPVINGFLAQDDEYTAIAAAAVESMKGGRNESIYVPAVKLLIDATLAVMVQERVQERLPSEVAARRRAAVQCGEALTGAMIKLGVLQRFYSENWDLEPFAEIAAPYIDNYEDYDGLRRFSFAPFHDMSVITGGAVAYLHKEGANISEDKPADIIKRSRSLMAISGVSLRKSRELFMFLGTPYALASHFRLVDGAPETKLAFNDETLDVIRSLGGAGCPTGHMATARDPKVTVLEDTSKRMIEYMAPAQATANQLPSPGFW